MQDPMRAVFALLTACLALLTAPPAVADAGASTDPDTICVWASVTVGQPVTGDVCVALQEHCGEFCQVIPSCTVTVVTIECRGVVSVKFQQRGAGLPIPDCVRNVGGRSCTIIVPTYYNQPANEWEGATICIGLSC